MDDKGTEPVDVGKEIMKQDQYKQILKNQLVTSSR